MDNKAKDHKSIAMRVSVVSMIINTILSIGKVAAGIIAGSGAMISDGVHSASYYVANYHLLLLVQL